MRPSFVTICTILLLALPGCTGLGGKFQPVGKCSPQGVSPTAALAKAPAWVPGSPTGSHMPTSGCIGGDGSHYPDRLCAVAEIEHVDAIDTATDLAREKSLRLLTEKLEHRLRDAVGPATPSEQIIELSQQLMAVISRTTGTWRSPNCTTYAIAEIQLADFQFVIQGPSVSTEVRAVLLSNADTIIGKP